MPSQFEFNADSPVYRRPTENLRSTLEILDSHFGLPGKKVLTVAGSGDFIIGYLQKGAASVQAIDISSSASAFAELKAISFFVLSAEDFNDFHSKLWNGEIDPLRQVYVEDLRKYLSEDSSSKLDSLFESGQLPEGVFKASRNHLIGFLPYTDSDTRVNGLQKFRVSNIDFEKFLTTTNESFDIIHCSNVLQYQFKDVEAKTDKVNALQAKRAWLERLRSRLNSGGAIADYCFSQNRNLLEDFWSLAECSGLFTQTFDVRNLKGSHDFVMVYSQKETSSG